MLVDPARGGAPLGDGPEEGGLPALHIPCRKDTGDTGHPVLITPDSTALSKSHPELLQHPRAFGSDKAHREQHQIAGKLIIGAFDLPKYEPAIYPVHLDEPKLERFEAAHFITDKAFSGDRIDPLAAFFMGGGNPVDIGPERPGIILCAL